MKYFPCLLFITNIESTKSEGDLETRLAQIKNNHHTRRNNKYGSAASEVFEFVNRRLADWRGVGEKRKIIMKTETILVFFAHIYISYGLYFHMGETEKKCFIEEIPDETMVTGKILMLAESSLIF